MGQRRCGSEPSIWLGIEGARLARACVLHAISSPALGPRFGACNTPAAAATSQPFQLACDVCTQKMAIPRRSQNGLGRSRPKSPESGPCSRFLPCTFTRMGLPTQVPARPGRTARRGRNRIRIGPDRDMASSNPSPMAQAAVSAMAIADRKASPAGRSYVAAGDATREPPSYILPKPSTRTRLRPCQRSRAQVATGDVRRLHPPDC
jgi:hypothetical protein